MPMADKTKDGAKVGKAKGSKRKVIEAAPKGDKTAQAENQKATSKKSKAFTADDNARMVVALGCPWNLTRQTLRKTFPSAESVNLVMRKRNFSGMVTLRFKTKEEADAVVKAGSVEIDGQSARITSWGATETPEEQEHRRNEELSRTVRLSDLPSGVTVKDVLEPFPSARGAHLIKNKRQQCNGSAEVIFATAAAAKAVIGSDVDVKGARVTPIAASDCKQPKVTPKVKKVVSPKPAAKSPTERNTSKKLQKVAKGFADS